MPALHRPDLSGMETGVNNDLTCEYRKTPTDNHHIRMIMKDIKEEMKMDKNENRNVKQLGMEELGSAAGGVVFYAPPLPGTRRRRWDDPNLVKPEPESKDGGATGGW